MRTSRKDQDIASGRRLRLRRTAALLVVHVEGDLATEVDELKVGLDPLRAPPCGSGGDL
jgi:hypothetical protein